MENLDNTVDEPKIRINEPKTVFLEYKIVLEKVIECPGCSIFFPSEELCARHLLHECLFPKNSNDDETLRTKFTRWLIRFFDTHFIKSATNNVKIGNDDERAPKRRHIENVFQNVQLLHIPFDLQCPVCQKYFCSHEVCSKHLFENCLQTKNSRSAITILYWFSQYLRTNSKSKLDRITDSNLLHRAEKRICNYCKKVFFDKECMVNHFRSYHRRESDTRDSLSLCSFCNFKPGSDGELFRHLIKVHVKCGCHEKQKDFSTLKTHLSGCPKSNGCLCPICQEVEVRSYETELEFERHILSCRKPVPLKLSLRDLYTECDICWQLILKCNLDIHVAEHIKCIDAARRQPTNTFVNLNDLKDVLSEKEVLKMKQLFK